jgi:hypothetical protein
MLLPYGDNGRRRNVVASPQDEGLPKNSGRDVFGRFRRTGNVGRVGQGVPLIFPIVGEYHPYCNHRLHHSCGSFSLRMARQKKIAFLLLRNIFVSNHQNARQEDEVSPFAAVDKFDPSSRRHYCHCYQQEDWKKLHHRAKQQRVGLALFFAEAAAAVVAVVSDFQTF